MKKAVSILLSALLLSLLLLPVLAAGDTLTLRLTADRISVAPGGKVTVTVEATENPGWNMFGATPRFDKSIMSLERIRYGSIGSGVPGTNATIDAGMKNTTATGVLFSYTLNVREDASLGDTVLGLTIRDGFIVSITEEDVPATANTVTVTVLDPAAETWGQTLEITDKDGKNVPFTFDDVDYDPAAGKVSLSESFIKEHPDSAYTVTFQNDAGETVKTVEKTPPASAAPDPAAPDTPSSPASPDAPASSGGDVSPASPADPGTPASPADPGAPADPGGSSSLPVVLGVSAAIILAVAAAIVLTVLKKTPKQKKSASKRK
ncbi:MAG: hypothetical protein J6Z79_01595 [Clostridia bacterium]|nr:hypothetical protein [Clostridia bacterium]